MNLATNKYIHIDDVDDDIHIDDDFRKVITMIAIVMVAIRHLRRNSYKKYCELVKTLMVIFSF